MTGNRKRRHVVLLEEQMRQVEYLAEKEHEGNVSRMLRELVREGLEARAAAQRAETVSAGG